MFIFLCPLIGQCASIPTFDWLTSDNGPMIPHCTSCICDVRSERESRANVKGPILEGTASIDALCQSQIRLRPNITLHCTAGQKRSFHPQKTICSSFVYLNIHYTLKYYNPLEVLLLVLNTINIRMLAHHQHSTKVWGFCYKIFSLTFHLK